MRILRKMRSSTKKTGLVKARFLLSMPVQVMLVGILLNLLYLPVYSQSPSPGLYDDNVDNGHEFSPQLLRVRTLVKANVLDLAQSILETGSPPSLPTREWLNWERQLWALYRARGDWEALYQRTRQIPPAFPRSIHNEAEIQAIYSFIELNRGKRARYLLRKHLLSALVSELDKRRLRKLMIESYLADNLLNEATIAMKNYQSDYRSQEKDWLLLSAQVYLRLNDANTAVNILAPLDHPSAKLLRIYARMENRSMTASQAIDAASKLLLDLESLPDRTALKAHQVLSVLIFAIQAAEQHLAAIDKIEQYLIAVSEQNSASTDSYPEYTVSDLTTAYSTVALDQANEHGLLVGDVSAWFNHLIRIPDDQVTVRKAISGYLLLNANEKFLQKQLNNIYIRSLIRSNHVDVISQMYGDDKPFSRLALSADIGLELSNFALANGNIKLAAEVNKELDVVPQGMDPLEWMLHVARISIIAGEYGKGAEKLVEWINEFDQLTQDETDQVLQPIFDLQTVNQHQLALDLLHLVNSRSHSARHNREIAYWIAESYQATRQYLKAADYFLFSALLKDNGFDQWGESARYQAAESLLSANLVTDSKVLFEGLLARAKEDNRKLQLQQKLQELWLLESSSRTSGD